MQNERKHKNYRVQRFLEMFTVHYLDLLLKEKKLDSKVSKSDSVVMCIPPMEKKEQIKDFLVSMGLAVSIKNEQDIFSFTIDLDDACDKYKLDLNNCLYPLLWHYAEILSVDELKQIQDCKEANEAFEFMNCNIGYNPFFTCLVPTKKLKEVGTCVPGDTMDYETIGYQREDSAYKINRYSLKTINLARLVLSDHYKQFQDQCPDPSTNAIKEELFRFFSELKPGQFPKVVTNEMGEYTGNKFELFKKYIDGKAELNSYWLSSN